MARRKRRTDAEKIAELYEEIARLKARKSGRDKFSGAAIKAERKRLELSAAQYGRLLGVSHLTIYNWEHGRTEPQQRQLDRWLEVQGMSQEDAHAELGIEPDTSGFTPDAIYEERVRLELSAADYGALVGVSPLTIYNWEKGKTKPQRKQLKAWEAVKGINKQKAWKQLGY